MTVFDGLKLPKVLFEASSDFNGNIQVVQVGNTRKIKVDHFDQSLSADSPSCSRLVWGKLVDVLKEHEPNLKKVLILGLGGGTMAHLISRNFVNPEIVSVEIDPVMAKIAKEYFDVDKIPHHKVIIEDALRVVIEPESFDIVPYSFDALVVDIFIGEKFPDLGSSGNFIAAIKKLVIPGGLIIFNRMYLEQHQDDVNNFIEYVSQYLRDVTCTVVAGYTNSDNVLISGRV